MKFRFLLLVVTALAAGCASVPRGGYYQDDGPHRRPEVDVSKVPDAVPRNEPYNERNNRPYSVFGVDYRPLKTAKGYRNAASPWYGRNFTGSAPRTAKPHMYAMTAAHKPCRYRRTCAYATE
jgi:rare lipoprotein A